MMLTIPLLFGLVGRMDDVAIGDLWTDFSQRYGSRIARDRNHRTGSGSLDLRRWDCINYRGMYNTGWPSFDKTVIFLQ